MSNLITQQKMHDETFMGSTNLSHVTGDEISVIGSLKVDTLNVVGDVNVAGTLEGKNISCCTLDVTGATKVAGLTVLGEANFASTFTLSASTDANFPNVLGGLSVAGESTALENVHIKGDITIHQPRSLNPLRTAPKQILSLMGTTHVEGCITFASGDGVVIQGSQVTIDGAISGATVEKI